MVRFLAGGQAAEGVPVGGLLYQVNNDFRAAGDGLA